MAKAEVIDIRTWRAPPARSKHSGKKVPSKGENLLAALTEAQDACRDLLGASVKAYICPPDQAKKRLNRLCHAAHDALVRMNDLEMRVRQIPMVGRS